MPLSEENLKEILNDPKKMLDLIRLFHSLLHVYEIEELKNKNKIETLGVNDSVELILKDNNGNIKEVR